MDLFHGRGGDFGGGGGLSTPGYRMQEGVGAISRETIPAPKNFKGILQTDRVIKVHQTVQVKAS